MNTNPSNNTFNPEKKIPVSAPQNHTLFNRITANLPQKLIALVCSLILFIVVLSDRNMSASFEKLPVQITLPDGYDTIEQIDNINAKIAEVKYLLRNISFEQRLEYFEVLIDDISDIKNVFDKLGIPEAEKKSLAGVGAQYDSEVVYHNLGEKYQNIELHNKYH